MTTAQKVTTPVARLIRGSVTKLQDKKDSLGKPKMQADGVTTMKEIYFEVAIPKAGEQHWAQTAWGAIIWQVGAAAFPQMCQNPAFAWKITDGDSAVPNRKNKVPNQQANYPGNWVLKLKSGFPPNVFMRNAAGALEQQTNPEFLKLGYWVQVALTIQGNGSNESPGVYVNPSLVCFSAYGEEIFVGPDAESAGFGAAPLPAGASATPLAGTMMPAAPGAAPAFPGAPGAPGAPGMPQPAAAMIPPPPAPAPAQMPAGLVPVPGAAYSIEQCRASGWSDDQIVASGYATRPVVAAPAPMPMPPAAPGMAPLPPGISAPAPAAPGAPIAPAGLAPNPAFVNPPGAPMPPAAPAAPMPPAAPAGPQLTAAGAALSTYAGFQAQGWNDAQLRAAGYLV